MEQQAGYNNLHRGTGISASVPGSQQGRSTTQKQADTPKLFLQTLFEEDNGKVKLHGVRSK